MFSFQDHLETQKHNIISFSTGRKRKGNKKSLNNSWDFIVNTTESKTLNDLQVCLNCMYHFSFWGHKILKRLPEIHAVRLTFKSPNHAGLLQYLYGCPTSVSTGIKIFNYSINGCGMWPCRKQVRWTGCTWPDSTRTKVECCTAKKEQIFCVIMACY